MKVNIYSRAQYLKWCEVNGIRIMSNNPYL